MEKDITIESLQKLDPNFDFSTAYNQNYCSLQMIRILPVQLLLKYELNGQAKELTDPEARFAIYYRHFGAESEFPIVDPPRLAFWKSESDARKALEQITQEFSLEKLDEAGIIATYLKKVEADARIQKFVRTIP